MTRENVSDTPSEAKKKRRSGIPTGNAGEYFVMAELLRRGYDAQLADRNTAGYDVLVGRQADESLRKVQIKTVRSPPWYVRPSDFDAASADRITIYVLIGKPNAADQVRYFVTRNGDLVGKLHRPPSWRSHAFLHIKHVVDFEGHWAVLGPPD